MTEKNLLNLGRRHFIKGCSLFLLGRHLIGASENKAEDKNVPLKLGAEFSAEEQNAINHSVMARLIKKNRTRGYNCAETILITSLEYLGKPQEWVSTAAGFGGGMGKRELCGLLTGGVMAIGIAGGIIHKDRKALLAFIREKREDYWNWWVERSPAKCQDMRDRYNGDGFQRMIQRVAAKIEELIKTAKT